MNVPESMERLSMEIIQTENKPSSNDLHTKQGWVRERHSKFSPAEIPVRNSRRGLKSDNSA